MLIFTLKINFKVISPNIFRYKAQHNVQSYSDPKKGIRPLKI